MFDLKVSIASVLQHPWSCRHPPDLNARPHQTSGHSVKRQVEKHRTRARFGAHSTIRNRRAAPVRASQANDDRTGQPRETVDCDVVIIGAGIVGLWVAYTLLRRNSKIRVVLVDRKGLCAGATGAGQGYIWMVARNPQDSFTWELASSSRKLWQQLVSESPQIAASIGWKETGSILLASCGEEMQRLQKQADELCAAGTPAQILEAGELRRMEPALAAVAGGLLVPEDAQLDGRAAAAALLRLCEGEGPGRFLGLLRRGVERVSSVAAPPSSSGRVVSQVDVPGYRIRCRHLVAATGVWTGSFLDEMLGDNSYLHHFIPRRGHLVDVELPCAPAALRCLASDQGLHRGLMECGYMNNHQVRADQLPVEVPVTFTATLSADRTRLLLGSSRETGTWEAEAQREVVQAILDRAAVFLPLVEELAEGSWLLQGSEAASDGSGTDGAKPSAGGGAGQELRAAGAEVGVRVGLRPFAVGGFPVIERMRGFENVVIAAGHEGSGLCMAPATAQRVAGMLMHDSGPVGMVPGA